MDWMYQTRVYQARRRRRADSCTATLDLAFGTTGYAIGRQAAPVTLATVRTSTAYYLSAAYGDTLLREAAADTACYDISGGLWSRPGRVNLIDHNVGTDAVSATYWVAGSGLLGTLRWNTNVPMYAGGSIACETDSEDPGDNFWLHKEDITLAAKYYLIGLLVNISGGNSGSNPTNYVVPCCPTANNALTGNICSGNPGVTQGNQRYRYLFNYGSNAYFEVWEKVLGTVDTYNPGCRYPIGAGAADVVALTMYLDNDEATYASGLGEWGGCIPNAAGAATTTLDSHKLTWASADRAKLLPIRDDGEWAIVMEVAWGLNGSDFTAGQHPTTKEYLLSWGSYTKGDMIWWNYSNPGFWGQYLYDAATGQHEIVKQLARGTVPFTSMWVGVTGKPGVKATLWTGATEAALFVGAGTESDGVQGTNSTQFANGVRLGAMDDQTILDGNAIGGNLGGVIRRLKLYRRKLA